MLGDDCTCPAVSLCPEGWPGWAQLAHLAGGHGLVPQHHPLGLEDHLLVHQLGRAGQEGLGQGGQRAEWGQMCLGTAALPSWWGETCQKAPQPPAETSDRPGASRTPASLPHLQDEGLAVKGNFDGVHSVPVLLR